METIDKNKLNNLLDKKLSKNDVEELSKEIIKKVKELKKREKNKKRKEQLDFLEKKFDLKIALLTFKTNRFFCLNNWDKLKIPLPFSKGIYFWGKEIINPNHFDENTFNKFVIENLNKNLKIIDAYF